MAKQHGRRNPLTRSFNYFSGVLDVMGPFLEGARVPFVYGGTAKKSPP
jgi:hypothetical protein